MLISRRLPPLPGLRTVQNSITALSDIISQRPRFAIPANSVSQTGFPELEYAPSTPPANFIPPGPSARLSLPLEPLYRASYNELEYLKLYLRRLADPAIAQSFATDLQPDLAATQASLTRRYTETFKTTSITALLADLDRTHARLATWAFSCARLNLSPGTTTRQTFVTHGAALWATRYAALKHRVDTLLQPFTYRRQSLRYVGSLTHGLRGAHKGRSVMDLDDFDVDLFVVHAAEWRRWRPHLEQHFPTHFSNGKIFPKGTDVVELTGLGDAVGWALAEGLRGYTAAAERFRWGTEVVLREEDAY